MSAVGNAVVLCDICFWLVTVPSLLLPFIFFCMVFVDKEQWGDRLLHEMESSLHLVESCITSMNGWCLQDHFGEGRLRCAGNGYEWSVDDERWLMLHPVWHFFLRSKIAPPWPLWFGPRPRRRTPYWMLFIVSVRQKYEDMHEEKRFYARLITADEKSRAN